MRSARSLVWAWGVRFALLVLAASAWPDSARCYGTLRNASADTPIVRRAASPEIVQELRTALDRAKVRFEARDTAGVLASVSERYRTGPFTKAEVRQQLVAIYEIYPAVRARVTIDAVEMVGDTAWVYTTGEITGRLPVLGSWMTVMSWERELEVARREGAVWRLFGYQQ